MTRRLCAAGGSCRLARYGPHTTIDGWLPAEAGPGSTLCALDHSDVAAAVAGLWHVHLGLLRMIRETSRISAEIRTPSPAPPIPINVHAEAMTEEIERRVRECAELVLDALDEDPASARTLPARIEVLEEHLDELVTLPASWVVTFGRDGRRTGFEVDGPMLSLALVDLHRRGRTAAGLTVQRERMPLPCPRCERRCLGRDIGTDRVDCTACRGEWTLDGYRQLTVIGAAAAGKAATR
ncbi:hypothetical protein DW322_00855 [Rhodococcus rhodnii]|uniref:Uncharacterized protein n=2 Tax=Rhodococcus rhodnii TaxID=38312 RepID=R7WPQ1_9NOCA|nr:hypothetical protein [Rhodococcus rhodnii]EOM77283.1 hypothetical protein Rrhod_1345 [Rhodococcus rhodnii LMG 5362]TXG88255.1 hypothetical protein DW322_21465 [Rhodococcus rhodnii]TXG89053.1 hypothetical protein DW322_00855 [Rhodococcus rhodnii]